LAIQLNGLADDAWIAAKLVAPETVAKQNDMIAPRMVFISRKKASQGGLYAKDGEEIGLDSSALQSFRVFSGAYIEAGASVRGHFAERAVLALPIKVIRWGNREEG
jgi:hypothetical protein